MIDWRKIFAYNPETGEVAMIDRKMGEPKWLIGSLNPEGYRRVAYKRRTYMVHRIAIAVTTGEWPEGHIDHINGDRGDNRLENIRLADPTKNSWNRRAPPNKSGFKGVSYNPNTKGWEARIMAHGKRIYLGKYDDPQHAGHAYNKAAIVHHGEFATLNPIGLDKVL